MRYEVQTFKIYTVFTIRFQLTSNPTSVFPNAVIVLLLLHHSNTWLISLSSNLISYYAIVALAPPFVIIYSSGIEHFHLLDLYEMKGIATMTLAESFFIIFQCKEFIVGSWF